MGHTPGPWIKRQIAPHSPSTGYSVHRDLGKAGISLTVAVVPTLENANLIAAAPALLAALKDVTRTTEQLLFERDHPRDQADDCSLCRDVVRAKAAIAAAVRS